MLQCAQYGLEPDTPLQLCHIIPFGKKATMMLNYRGVIQLVENTGELEYITVKAVYEKDKFELRDTQNGIEYVWERVLDGDRGKLRGVYCKVKKCGSNQPIVEYMSRKEVEKIMARSPAVMKGRQSPWKTDFEPMGLKTVLKKTLKYLPMSAAAKERHPEMYGAIDADNRIEAGKMAPSLELQELMAEAKKAVGAPEEPPKDNSGALANNLSEPEAVEPEVQTTPLPEDQKVEPPPGKIDGVAKKRRTTAASKHGATKATKKNKGKATKKNKGKATKTTQSTKPKKQTKKEQAKAEEEKLKLYLDPGAEELANCEALKKDELKTILNKLLAKMPTQDHFVQFWGGVSKRWEIKAHTPVTLKKEQLYKVVASMKLYIRHNTQHDLFGG
jgi:recombination protein RecT